MHPAVEQEPIKRGYIRRANTEIGDASSSAKFNFMYNPEQIVRDYVSYLDQATIDPFNTVYNSNNLVAPPSFMNFNFELLFDRGDEVAATPNHRGVLVDYEYFDLVVRNVVPNTSGATNNSVPDNGVMMVNPRDITVIFSDYITVTGRPINAQVTFEKFSHRMIPTRMRIALEMRVTYIGPLSGAGGDFGNSIGIQDSTTATTLPTDSDVSPRTVADLYGFNRISESVVTTPATPEGDAALPSTVEITVKSASPVVNTYVDTTTRVANNNATARVAVINWLRAHMRNGYTQYSSDWSKIWQGVDSTGYLHYTACSPFVITGYTKTCGTRNLRGWGYGSGNSTSMINGFNFGKFTAGKKGHNGELIYAWSHNDHASADAAIGISIAQSAGAATYDQAKKWFSSATNRKSIMPGDLAFAYKAWQPGRPTGHVGIITRVDDKYITVLHAAGGQAGVLEQVMTISHFMDLFHMIVRPNPLGNDVITANVGTTNNFETTGRNYV
jgi:hypothetical protein